MVSRFEGITPRLATASLYDTVRFYVDVLEFRPCVAWPDGQPTFVILERGAVRVGFFEARAGQPVTTRTAELCFDVAGVAELYHQVRERAVVEWGPEVYPYGRREFAVRDPAGNLVIFSEPTDDPATTRERG